MITFEVPGAPQGKGRARVTVRSGFAHQYTPDETARYENLIKLYYQKCSNEYIASAAVVMQIDAFFAVPASWSQKKRQKALSGRICPVVKPDSDNIAKVVADALNGVAYADDKQICKMSISKSYGAQPKLIVHMAQIGHDNKHESER